MKIYVASSWRNKRQQGVVQYLREQGHEVYDFKNPTADNRGFHWSDIDPEWQKWTAPRFRRGLEHDLARDGFGKDMDALKWADAVVLVQPCGRSAHLELGWAVGAGKFTAILLTDGEPELMYKMVDVVAVGIDEIARALRVEQLNPTPP
jgi:hypothetical protein